MIIKILKYIHIFLLAVLIVSEGFTFCYSQNIIIGKEKQSLQTDHSKIKVEPVPVQKIKDYKSDNAFNYHVAKDTGLGIWSILRYWLNKILQKVFSNKGVVPYIWYVLILLTFIFVIYKIIGGNLSGIFSSNKKVKGTNGFDYFEEDIHQQDIDQQLNEAIKNKNFRDAIRYYYLILLKKLDANELIQWEVGKTNRDYQKELASLPILDDFMKLSGIYEYSWYGNFEVKEERFTKWQSGFTDVFQNINQ